MVLLITLLSLIVVPRLIMYVSDRLFFRACDDRIKGKLHSNHNSFEQQAKAWRDMWDGN